MDPRRQSIHFYRVAQLVHKPKKKTDIWNLLLLQGPKYFLGTFLAFIICIFFSLRKIKKSMTQKWTIERLCTNRVSGRRRPVNCFADIHFGWWPWEKFLLVLRWIFSAIPRVATGKKLVCLQSDGAP